MFTGEVEKEKKVGGVGQGRSSAGDTRKMWGEKDFVTSEKRADLKGRGGEKSQQERGRLQMSDEFEQTDNGVRTEQKGKLERGGL